ncbi:MAG: PEP-utilizing enzyme [Candidatus Magasanikbacteria bacterium]
MIKLKIHTIAKKLGKNISEISQETGINRNTITALYHGEAEGVWFSTLDRICERYGLNITDIVEFEPKQNEESTPKMYRQILTLSPIIFWPRIAGIIHPNPKFFDEGLGTCDVYFKNGVCEVFWHTTSSFAEMAEAVYKEYGELSRRHFELKESFFDYGKKVEAFCQEYATGFPLEWGVNELLNFLEQWQNTLEKFWSTAIFIDSFDLGFDNKEVARIGKIYNFTQAEIAELLTSENILDKSLQTKERMARAKKHRQLIKTILKKYKLSVDPLEFFKELGQWREYRQTVNVQVQELWNKLFKRLEKTTGVEANFLYFLTFEELDNLLHGLIKKHTLKNRFNQGLLLSILGKDYKIIEGTEVKKVYEELQEILQQSELGHSVAGKVGAQGYAQGVARVIEKKEDIKKFQIGEILIAEMTDDSMLEIIKKAGAIVTNAGGMLCHAAINARLAGKPCIINTHTATTQIKTGDIVAVRANHGTVRILTPQNNN